MTALRELDLSGNLLRGLPEALATLPKLEVQAVGWLQRMWRHAAV